MLKTYYFIWPNGQLGQVERTEAQIKQVKNSIFRFFETPEEAGADFRSRFL